MSIHEHGDRETGVVEAQPTTCPFCGSHAIAAASQKRTAGTYSRCEACGQIWHPARLRESRGQR
jgi:predicted RNA-binding Zn-ribbon protein involved in translation (DUF1610 family)